MRQLKSIFSDIKAWFSALTFKKTLVVIIIALLITLPTAFAVFHVIYVDHIQSANYFSVTLYDSNGQRIAYESDQPDSADESSITYIFYNIISKKTSFGKTDGEDAKYIRAVTTLNGTTSEIKCYFSFGDAGGYYTDSSGRAYAISASLNDKFMATPHAEVFYSSSVIPQLITIDNDVVTPKSINWNYKNIDGNYMTATRNSLELGQKVYEIAGGMGISFSVEPSSSSVRVYEKNKLIHTGSYKDLANWTVNTGNELRVTVYAEWNKSQSTSAYGSISYDFTVRIKNRSEFSISSNSIEAGKFVVLSCTNITDISKIKFESDVKDFTPIFQRLGNGAITIIPFEHDTKKTSFDFKVSYGASSRDFSVKIQSNVTKGEYHYGYDLFDRPDEPERTIDTILSTIKALHPTHNEHVYYSGRFDHPTLLGFEEAYSHNSTVYWGENEENSFVAIGNEFLTDSDETCGRSVPVLNNGAVVLIGNDALLGNYVVVDHGCGLRTWYTNLSAIDVEQGELLTRGQSVGKTAERSFEGREGFTLYCTVYETVIDTSILWDTSVFN